MTDRTEDLAERALARRKREDSAFALPVLGLLLLASPLLDLVAGDLQVFGIPAAYAYVFAAWIGLILLTRALARRLMRGTGS